MKKLVIIFAVSASTNMIVFILQEGDEYDGSGCISIYSNNVSLYIF